MALPAGKYGVTKKQYDFLKKEVKKKNSKKGRS